MQGTSRSRIPAALAVSLLLVAVPGMASASPQEPAPQEPAATPAAPQPAADTGPRTEGLIPGILIGPKVSATLLFPPNVMVGGELKVIGYIGASFEYGVFPRSQAVSGYSLSINSWSAGLRAYPFRGAFFVGAVLGRYDLTGTEISGIPGGTATTTTLNVTSMYLGPQIGWKWAFDFGLFLGLNLGYGFSLDYKSVLTPLNATGDLKNAQDNLDKYLKPGAPIFTLLELGWLF